MINETKLPGYLRAAYDAAVKENQCIVCGDVRLSVLTPELIRIEQGAFTDAATTQVICRAFAPCGFDVRREDGWLTIDTGTLTVRYAEGRPLDESSLSIRRLTPPRFEWHYGERPLQNLGGTASTLDEANGAIEIGEGMCAIDGFSTLDDSASPCMTQEGWFTPHAPGTDLYFFGYGHDYTACVRDYCLLTGQNPMLPAYALGNWWSRYHKYTQEEYLSLMDRFAREDVPLSVAIVDMDWHITDGDGRAYWTDGWTGYTWNRALFPDYRAFLDALHERNLRTALNLHPASGVRSWEAQYEDMARAMGKEPEKNGRVPFNCLDPKFLKAYFELLHFPYERDGVDFWWLDWQQGNNYEEITCGEPYDRAIASITPLWMLNHMHYTAACREGRRGMIFSRFSGHGSQRYPIGFSGDTVISWESLDFQPRFTAAASNVGYGWWSHDIGGHMLGVKDDELTVRWIQLGVFSPIFRLHSTANPFTGREPWNYDKRAEIVIKDFMRLRHRLFPYLYTMCHRSHTQHLPLVRPMYHTNPEEPQAYRVPNQYWFGSEMIAAPITRKADPKSGLGEAEVFLPQGTYVDAFTGFVYRGGRVIRALRPLEQTPVFLKAGAIVPLQAHTPHGNLLGAAKRLELLIAPGADGSFTLYEDDGVTLDYKKGAFCTTQMTLDWQGGSACLHIAPAEGDLSLLPPERGYVLLVRGAAKGTKAFMDGQPLSGEYDEETCTLRAELPAAPVTQARCVTFAREGGILHDNGDYMARIMRLITRAQMPAFEKDELLRACSRALEKEKTRGFLRRVDLMSGSGSNLPEAMFELMSQKIE